MYRKGIQFRTGASFVDRNGKEIFTGIENIVHRSKLIEQEKVQMETDSFVVFVLPYLNVCLSFF